MFFQLSVVADISYSQNKLHTTWLGSQSGLDIWPANAAHTLHDFSSEFSARQQLVEANLF